MTLLPPVAAPPFLGGSPATSHARRFTDREQQILRLIAEDKSDKQIAHALSMSPHTLRTHLSRIYARHGVHSRAAAVARWLMAGLQSAR